MMVNLDFSVLDNKWNETLPNFKKVIKKASNHVFDELIQFKNKDYEIIFLIVNNDYIKE